MIGERTWVDGKMQEWKTQNAYKYICVYDLLLMSKTCVLKFDLFYVEGNISIILID